MSLSSLRREARKALNGKWGNAVFLILVYALVTMVVPFGVEVVFSGGWEAWLYQETVPASASIVSMFVSFALIPLSVVLYWVFLDAYRNEPIRIAPLFTVYQNGKLALKLIGTSLLFGLFVFLWSLLLIIPGIIKSLSYSQTFFLLKDHPEYSALQAISESKKRMKGYKGKLFLLYLSFIGWGLLSMLTFGIGFLWLVPYIYTSLAAFYDQFIRTQEAPAE
ncbi:DUF975 domain-containing protein [Anoxybacillus ayderensis]|uniref:DUF975 family protein n=1 Tax=Anoxybacillus gonensis TaxID=198467 RepID=UPI0002BEBE6A|nr:DUF975 family protein [Anoxybacillus gonensis]AXM87813.1 DUF975 domain-containing protein [Anoxybacillus ayderensis G10]EMI09417.1 integral membrane protein [Anoxybacillus gonensis]THD16280.1 DUF975 domain-containing protein [Anoxybacillus ayderensis]